MGNAAKAVTHTPQGDVREVREKLPLGWYAAGGACVVYACLFPLYRPLHLVLFFAFAAAAGLLAQHFAPVRVRLVPCPAPPPATTGDEAADQLLAQGREALAQLRQANAALPDADITALLDRIEAACTQIFEQIRQHPQQAGQMRRFMNYYLPTVLQLVQVRASLEGKGSGENVEGTRRRILFALQQAASAFETFHDRLHADEAMDVNAEASVFENMLRQEALLPSDSAQANAQATPPAAPTAPTEN